MQTNARYSPTKQVGLALAMATSLAGSLYAQQNVVQPSDPIIASSSNSPGSEGVKNAIDGTQAKYLNFDSANDAKPSGFVVTPTVGQTWVTGIALQSANDAADRDPKEITLEGSNDDTITNFTSGTWEMIVDLQVPTFTSRFQTQTFSFPNFKPYKSYRWTVLHTAGPSSCCMQIAEVQLLGTVVPPNVVQPSDAIIASSSNSPGSEGVKNAIDGTQAKYLNFDSANDAKPSGFVVTPQVGATVVVGLTMQAANDAAERDPKAITLEGSNDDSITNFNSGTWVLIYQNDNIPTFTSRFQSQTFLFQNVTPYKNYRWTVVHTAGPSSCCMQIAEVKLLGSGAPQNVVQPSDPIIASSSNSPGSEGVKNAIDGTQAKYLNFDSANDAKPSGFVVTPSVGPTTITGLGLQAANDAADRDPKEVTIEGSNDAAITNFNSGTWTLIADLQVPTFTARFQWQYFYFTNQTAYKSYRWTVLHTAGPSSCCMQISEVQFLAVTTKTDCNKAHFVVQPADTPVLTGSSATFFATVNGPWPLQWFVNGSKIPGATKPSYTTDPVDANSATNVYTVQIVGCELSSPAHAVIFSPSATKSVAVHFNGGGANGAPTAMLTNDIAGVQLQAFWNDETQGSGTDGSLVDSDNNATSITAEWATSGNWGAGTGTLSPTARMLNGLVGRNGPGDNTFTFHNVPAGSHALLIYSISPPLQFQEVSFAVPGLPTIYQRTMEAGEYLAAPGFYRSTSTNQAKPTVGDFVRFDGVKPDAIGDITLTFNVLTAGFDRQTGINDIQLVLNAPNPGAPPVITQDPQPTVAPTNGTATLTVVATGDNLTYQWRKNGRNLPDGAGVSGTKTATLAISSFSAANAGVYSVAVFNPAGSTISKNAVATPSAYNISDALVSYWKFEESSGTNAANVIAKGKPAGVVGNATWGTGQIGKGFTFDGTTYVFVPDYPKATKQIAVSAWVNVANGASGDVAIIRNAQPNLYVSGGATRVVGQFEITLVFDAASGNLFPSAAIGIGPNVARVTSSTAFPTGSWHHLAMSADGALLALYVDGQQVATTDYLADINSPDIPYIVMGGRLAVDPATMTLGPAPDPQYLTGSLDDVAVWTRALTASEVQALYTTGKAGKEVTTVQETVPATSLGPLKVSRTGNTLTVTWTGGVLQTATTITGPWTDSTGASPFTDTVAANSAKFYRTRSQ